MKLQRFFEIAADNAQASDVSWDDYFHSMDRIYAWQDWKDRKMGIQRNKCSEAELEQHPYWVSWYCPNDMMGKFELHSPWWISGETMEDDAGKFAFTVCAAVMATSEDQAKLKVIMSHDAPYVSRANAETEWRFAERRPDDWSPFSDRFPRADWMQWDGSPTPSS